MKVGIVGAGGMGGVHARQYGKMPDVEASFYEVDPERAKAYSERTGLRPIESFEKLVAESDVVDVCLPTDLHLDFGLKVIAAGKALFLEKPVAGTFEDGMKLHDAAEKAGVPYMPGQVVRYFPEFAAGKARVSEGTVGQAFAARTYRGGLAPTGSGSWFMDHSRSGGVLLDLAIHDFDWLRWTFGEAQMVNARSLGAASGKGPDYALTVIHFKSGVVSHSESTWMNPSGFRTAFDVSGSKGVIEFDSRQTQSIRVHNVGKSGGEGPQAPLDDPYYRQLRAFVDAVGSGEKPPVTGLDGAMAVGISLAALQSAREKRAVSVPTP